MSPALNGNSMLQHFECSNIVKIRNERLFDFHPGLSHVHDVTHSPSDGQTHSQDTSDGPDVNLVAVTLLAKNLRSNVVWSATQGAGVCVCRRRDGVGH